MDTIEGNVFRGNHRSRTRLAWGARLRPELIQEQSKSCAGFSDLLLNHFGSRVLIGLFQVLIEFQHSGRYVIVIGA
jgi:hypothetical protein